MTKAQLAKMLLKAKYGSAYMPATIATGTVFDDVATNSFRAEWIEALDAQSITERCDANNFCPTEAVMSEVFFKMLNKTFP